jgi:uncharacterized OB-fold protein
MMSRVCQSCGRTFFPRESYHWYCDTCYRAERQRIAQTATPTAAAYGADHTAAALPSRICPECGRSFVPRESYFRLCNACYWQKKRAETAPASRNAQRWPCESNSQPARSLPSELSERASAAAPIKPVVTRVPTLSVNSPQPRVYRSTYKGPRVGAVFANSCGVVFGALLFKGALLLVGLLFLLAVSQCG